MTPQLERISRPPHSSITVFDYEGRNFDAPWHYHPELELTYIAQSNGIRYVGDSIMEFEPGDLVLLGPNLPHCWKNMGPQKEVASSIVIQWQAGILGEGWMDKSEFSQIKKLLHTASRGIRFKGGPVKKTIPILREMLNQSPFDALISLLCVLQKLSVSKNSTLLSSKNFPVQLNQKTNSNIDRIQNYVAKHYRDTITLKEVSSLVAMSEETFCRFFKRTYNKSFFTFLNEYKITLACKMLLESQKQVSDIAYLSGYESLPFFYRQFKKFVGYSPLEYQKKYLGTFSR